MAKVHTFCTQVEAHATVKKTLVKVKVLIQLLYSEIMKHLRDLYGLFLCKHLACFTPSLSYYVFYVAPFFSFIKFLVCDLSRLTDQPHRSDILQFFII